MQNLYRIFAFMYNIVVFNVIIATTKIIITKIKKKNWRGYSKGKLNFF